MVRDLFDPGLTADAVSDDGNLPAMIRLGLVPHADESHCQERNRDLLAGCHQNVILTQIREFAGIISQSNQLVGFTGHG